MDQFVVTEAWIGEVRRLTLAAPGTSPASPSTLFSNFSQTLSQPSKALLSSVRAAELASAEVDRSEATRFRMRGE